VCIRLLAKILFHYLQLPFIFSNEE